jgi:hypothetical protein
MTEGVIAAVIVIAAWLAALARRRGFWALLLLGLLLGVATLVRPQSLLLAPLLGLCATHGEKPGWRKRAFTAVATTAIAVATFAPWTVRNCLRMDRCVLVSANGGWNLLIGAAPEADGTFAPVADELVPSECRSVFGEATKDACFARAAFGSIARAPLTWLARVPRKLAHTFDYGGAPGWYLNASNPGAFGERAKLVLGSAETIWQRGAALLAIIGLSLLSGPRARARRVLGAVATPLAWPGMLGLVAQGLLLGRNLASHLPALTAVAAVATTTLSHAVFFGAGRYSMACYGAIALLSAAAIRRSQAPEGHRGR